MKIDLTIPQQQKRLVKTVTPGHVFVDQHNQAFIKDHEGGITRLDDGMYFDKDSCVVQHWNCVHDFGPLEVTFNGEADDE